MTEKTKQKMILSNPLLRNTNKNNAKKIQTWKLIQKAQKLSSFRKEAKEYDDTNCTPIC